MSLGHGGGADAFHPKTGKSTPSADKVRRCLKPRLGQRAHCFLAEITVLEVSVVAELNWSFLEVFLVLYREGSLAAAARQLGVEQSTVSRRLASLEDQVGQILFVRGKRGLTPTEAAEQLAPVCASIETKVRHAEMVVSNVGARPEGLVRLAVPEALADYFIVPSLGELLERFPRLRVEVSSGSHIENIAELKADLAVRFVKPTGGDVTAIRLGSMVCGVLGSVHYRCAPGASLRELDWISWTGELSYLPEARWLAQNVGSRAKVGVSRGTTLVEAVRAGLGVAILPRFFRDYFEGLREWPLPPDVTPMSHEVWLVKPIVHRTNSAIAAVSSWLQAWWLSRAPSDLDRAPGAGARARGS